MPTRRFAVLAIVLTLVGWGCNDGRTAKLEAVPTTWALDVLSSPSLVALDDEALYFVERRRLYRAERDRGGLPEVLEFEVDLSGRVAIDARELFWARPTERRILAVPKRTSGGWRIVAKGEVFGDDLLDGGDVLFGRRHGGPVLAIGKQDGRVREVSPRPATPFAHRDGRLWLLADDGTIVHVPIAGGAEVVVGLIPRAFRAVLVGDRVFACVDAADRTARHGDSLQAVAAREAARVLVDGLPSCGVTVVGDRVIAVSSALYDGATQIHAQLHEVDPTSLGVTSRRAPGENVVTVLGDRRQLFLQDSRRIHRETR